jgi:hypothetical protein
VRTSIPSLTIGVFLLLLGATACSSTSTAAQSASPATASGAISSLAANAPPAGPAAGGSDEDGLGHPVNICALMPAASAAKISGIAVTVAQEDDTPSYKIYSCNYTNAAGTAGFDINVLAMYATAGFDGSVSAAGAASHPITGLGDKAASSVLGVEAVFGNVSITVSGLPSDAASEALIRALQPKL